MRCGQTARHDLPVVCLDLIVLPPPPGSKFVSLARHLLPAAVDGAIEVGDAMVQGEADQLGRGVDCAMSTMSVKP